VVAFLAREIDEGGLRSRGWAPEVGATLWYATYAGGHRDQPYRMSGPSGVFTRHRGDHPESLYRLDDDGGWVFDLPAGEWQPDDAPVRLYELGRLSPEEVDALYELDDWGAWYFDYRIGDWALADAPRASYYLAELDLHEVDRTEAAKVATALGVASAITD
jgi:hypothetical protein